jgi:uncharacterized protein (TIGR00251 family)
MSAESLSDILCSFDNGVRLSVRVKPGLSHTRESKVVDIGDGKRAMEVSIAAEARDGKANNALVERLSEICGVGKRQIEIKSGKTSRLKIIEIRGNAQTLISRITGMLPDC